MKGNKIAETDQIVDDLNHNYFYPIHQESEQTNFEFSLLTQIKLRERESILYLKTSNAQWTNSEQLESNTINESNPERPRVMKFSPMKFYGCAASRSFS